MIQILDISLVLIILSSFFLLGIRSYRPMIKAFALQAILLSLMPLFTHLSYEAFFLSFVLVLTKGFIFPWILLRTLKNTHVLEEKSLIISPAKSILLGLVALVFAFWFSARLPVQAPFTSFTMAVAFFTLLSGLFCIMGRKSAFNQVIGYLIFENGIFLLAINLAQGIPLMIELGVLFDVFAGLIIMTVAIGHIGREFEHVDGNYLNQLKG